MPIRQEVWVRGWMVALLLLLATSAGRAQSEVTPAAAQVVGQRVESVRVVTETGDVIAQDPADLPLRAGQPFAFDTERDSLRQLFRTGQYSDVAAQVMQEGGGVRVDFVIRHNFYINQVRVEGLNDAPLEAVALSSLRLNFGEIFREADMAMALDRLRQALQDEGFYQAKLIYKVTPYPETQQMDIAVQVEPGKRATVGMISLANQTPFPEGDLSRRLKFKTRTQISLQRLNNGADNVRKWLVSKNYLGARVSLERGAYDASTNQVPMQVNLFAGPEIQVSVKGLSLSSGTRRRLLPIYEEGAVDEDLLQEGRRNLRDYVQSLGYFDAEVNYTISQEPAALVASSGPPPLPPTPPVGPEVIAYMVERGARHRLVGVEFVGNRYFSEDLLRSRLQIQPAAFLSRGRFSSALVAADTASLTALYEANGFQQAKVTSEVINNYGGNTGDLFVRFHIEEGLQTRVSKLTVEGNRAVPIDALMAVIGSSEGQPYSDFNVASDRDNILALYYDRGFSQARFTSMAEPDANAENGAMRVRLTYRIEEGTQTRVSRILISGNEHTRLNVVRREIQLREGEPLSQGAAVESQRRLYDLGVFSRVSIGPQNPTGTEPNKTVGVLVEEAKRYTFAYGFGFEAQRAGDADTGPVGSALRFSPRGTLEITKLNFTGRADTLSFKVRASTFQGRSLLTYTAPNYFGRSNLSLQLSAFYEKARDVLTFTSRRTEGSIQLTDKLSLTSSILLRYAYRRVIASDLRITPQAIPLFSQPTQVSLVGATWVRDRRDSPSDATRGMYNTANMDVALRPLGSSASFVRAFVQSSNYRPIGKRLVWASSFRIGVQTPFGGSDPVDISLPERFFAGGSTTLRGFGLNQAGPRDPTTGFPIGGLGMLILNEQLQFPMRLPFVGNRVGGAFFYDGGNVFNTFRQISFRTAPPAPEFDPAQPNRCVANCSNRMNYFSHTIGFELRYRTPVGPVSIDLAYQLNPARFLVPDGTVLPNGAPGLTTSRLPSFQFSVNLGSPF